MNNEQNPRPNKAIEPTASRRTTQLSMSSTHQVLPRAPSLASAHLVLVRPMIPYTPAERREFIDSHIAHRLTALLAVVKRQLDPTFFSGKGDLYCGCIEGAYIMLRVFIEFLGVESSHAGGSLHLVQRTRQKTKNQKQARDTDVMLDCFGLPLLSPSDFGSAEPMIALFTTAFPRLLPILHIAPIISSTPRLTFFLLSSLFCTCCMTTSSGRSRRHQNAIRICLNEPNA